MKINTDEKAIDNVLTRGVEEIFSEKEELKKLLMSGKQIKLYCGYDATAPSLQLGNAVSIKKLSEFQKLGHKVIFLIFGSNNRQPILNSQCLLCYNQSIS